jgi:hypothetical protein
MRRLAFVAAVFIVACAALKQPPAPVPVAMTARDGNGLSLSAEVVQQIAAMMRRGIREQIEPAACVASYRIWADGTSKKVDVYALTLADVDSADELNIWYHGPHLCDDSMPSVHGHVTRRWLVPFASPVDSSTLARFSAPFGLIAYRADDSTVGIVVHWKVKP